MIRGSFYTYFTGKEDVVEFLLEDQSEQIQELCQDTLTDSGGDYFAMMERLFEYFIGESRKAEEMIQVARNIFSCQESTQFLGVGKWPPPDDTVSALSPARWIYERADRGRYRNQTAEGFIPVSMLATSAMVFSLKQYYEYPEKLEWIRENFHRALDIIKYGSYREPAEQK